MRILIAGRVPADAPSGEGRCVGRFVELLGAEHDVDVVVGKPGDPGLAGQVRSRVGLEVAVRRRAQAASPDLVIAFAPEVPSGLARTVAVLGPLPSASAPSGLGRLRGRIRAARTQGRDAILVPTRIAAERRPKGGPQVFHPGPGPAFDGSAEPPGDGPIRIVQLGSLRADKGAHLTVEAAHSLTRERGRVELHLVGREDEPGYVSKLRRRAEGLDLRVRTEPLSVAQRAELLSSAHILSAPATADGTWGFALAEAMRCGVPVVHSNIGDHRELVGRHGVEVQAGDVKQLGSAFRKLLRDREHWEDRSAAARAEASARYGDEAAIRARLGRLLAD